MTDTAEITTEDWTFAEQATRARNLASAMHDELSHLWILARGGEPTTAMEKLVRSQIDDAAADTVDIYTELKLTIEWLVDHSETEARRRTPERDQAFERFFLELSSQGALLAMLQSYPTAFAAFQEVQRWRALDLAQERHRGSAESEAAE